MAEREEPTTPRPELTPDTLRFCPLCGATVARRVVARDLREHPVCSGCGFVCYLHPKIVAVTIPVRDGRVLLARRAIEPAHGLWTFPGGYVDWGESVAEAARREMREEVGLDLDPTGLVGIYSYPGAPAVIVVYHVTVPDGLDAAADAHEVSETGYFSREEIPWDSLAFRSTREALEDWFRRQGV
ncbi:MAG TPA: NUDIX hydrolase [Methylomirabilota bacterium]|jgi:ADP-ribose pyrophosphatase YjhB (NUDIX family)|nr:NUDIX hydrolase [Methylomirabilota bacterium]